MYLNDLLWCISEVWRSNVHDVSKVCLETTLCVYACFGEFYVFVLDEIYLVGPKHVYEHIWVGNIWFIFDKTYMVGHKLVYEHIWVGNIQLRLHVGHIRGLKE